MRMDDDGHTIEDNQSAMVYAIILLGLLFTILGAWRLRDIPLRRIAAYNAMQTGVSQAVEGGRATHISFGGSALQDASSVSAIAGAEVAYHLAVRAALADKPSIITLADPVTLSLGQDRLWRAYRLRLMLNRYRGTLARWYPPGPLSLAFAAGVGTAILDEDLAMNILVGRFGPEMMLIAESAIRYDRSLVAQSDRVEGQAVAYVVADTPLIAEELYAGAAYLDRKPIHVGSVVAQDTLRYLIVVAIIVLAILSFLGVAF